MTLADASAETKAAEAFADAGAARTSKPATHITIRGLVKRFDGNTVYDGFDLDLPRGAIISIFGPNGCGKSTLINMIAGILPRDSGTVLFDGMTIAQTRIGYVFQNYREALFPWMRAIDNVAYPLEFAGIGAAECKRRIDELVAGFELSFDLHRYPYELSGGQQQTVSIMRALVVHPDVLFLDEPFSALDYEMTLVMRDQLQKVLATTRTTTLLVSHDLDEAIYLADRLLLLTRRPTRVAAFLDVPIARPREPAATINPSFTALKAQALAIFQAAVKGG